MRKWARWVSGAAAGVVGLALSVGAGAADEKKDAKVPSIEEIMSKGHAGGKSLMKKIGADAKAGKWDDATTNAKALAVFGEALGKNKPPKGGAESWKKLTEKYKTNTTGVLKAVEKKDSPATADALGALGKSCKECHDVHQEQ